MLWSNPRETLKPGSFSLITQKTHYFLKRSFRFKLEFCKLQHLSSFVQKSRLRKGERKRGGGAAGEEEVVKEGERGKGGGVGVGGEEEEGGESLCVGGGGAGWWKHIMVYRYTL